MSDPTPPSIPPVPAEAPYTPPPTDASIPAETRQMAMFCHLLAIVTSFIGPLILWQTQKEKSPFLDYHGKEALNFSITIAIGYLASIILTVVLIGVLLMPAVLIYGLVMLIIAGLKANDGIYYRYPFCLRFIK